MPGTTAIPEGSGTLRAGFVLLTLVLGALFVAAVWWSSLRTGADRRDAARRTVFAALGAGLWIAATDAAAARGLLHFEPPPTMGMVIAASIVLSIGLALSPVGRRIAIGLPIAALVGYQSFRIIVELLMHRAYVEGLMPVQMSYSGRNFDIVTGITALALAVWLATGTRSARARARLEHARRGSSRKHPDRGPPVGADAIPCLHERAGEHLDHPRTMGMAANGDGVRCGLWPRRRVPPARCVDRLIGRVSHVIGERVQLLAKRLTKVRRHLLFVERPIHAPQPLVALERRDREGQMARPKSRVAIPLDVRLRASRPHH